VACCTRGRQQLVEKFCSEYAEGRDLPRSVRRDNIKVDVTERGWEDLEWIRVAYDMAQERNVVNTVLNVRVSCNVTNSVSVSDHWIPKNYSDSWS
jgi:hypothetical protein